MSISMLAGLDVTLYVAFSVHVLCFGGISIKWSNRSNIFLNTQAFKTALHAYSIAYLLI